jgi:hypothetical protein
MNWPIPTPEAQVEFLRNMQRLLADGRTVASYKFALIRALADLAVLQDDDSGAALDHDTKDIGVKFVEQYWRQSRPFQVGGEATGSILRQNTKGQATMATQSVPGINSLESPLATVIFHYHESDSYAAEFVTATGPSRKPREVELPLPIVLFGRRKEPPWRTSLSGLST